MHLRRLSFVVLLALLLHYPALTFAANHTPRTCAAINAIAPENKSISPGGIGGTGNATEVPPGGIGGTGHEVTTSPGELVENAQSNKIHYTDIGGIAGTGHDVSAVSGGIEGTGHTSQTSSGGIGGTGHDVTTTPGGIGGTGHDSPIPSGGMGGTGIIAAGNLANVSGVVTVENQYQQKFELAIGDEICKGDKIATSHDAKAKIVFTDGATLYVLKNSEINVVDYNYSTEQPGLSLNALKLVKGDIRSVSGKIAKINPKYYSLSTPVSTIHVIGTDFLITHLTEQEGALDAGTYAKVISGEINVQSSSSSIRLRAGESSHVMLNGTQSVTSSSGGTCMAP